MFVIIKLYIMHFIVSNYACDPPICGKIALHETGLYSPKLGSTAIEY